MAVGAAEAMPKMARTTAKDRAEETILEERILKILEINEECEIEEVV